MKLERLLQRRFVLAACLVFAACADTGSDTPGMGTGGSGGGAVSGGAGGMIGSEQSPVAAGGSSVGAGGQAAAGAGIAGAGSGGSSGAVASAGSMSLAGMGGQSGAGGSMAGSGGGGGSMGGQGAAGAAGSDGAAPTASSEDDGADCAVSELPAAGSLPTIAMLPDPFKKLDGTRMSNKADWRCRREEIKRMAEAFAFGVKPPPPESVEGTVSNTSISVNVSDKGKSTRLSATVRLPMGGTAPYPAIIVYGGAGFGSPLDSSVINSEGIALITYDPFTAGREGTPRNNKQGAFYDLYGSNSTTGLLVAWGWGVSRIIDAIEKSGGSILKADAVGVTGCSRFGKGAFLAGVFDQRVALTMPVESGTAGVPIWRGIPGEGAQTLSSGYGEQPWFGDAFSAFTSSPTKAPIDTHELVAMVAPRGLFIMDNPHIANLGPKSAHVAALAGAEVYKALGAGDNITYWSDVQNGAHCAQRPEWSAPLRSSIQRFLKKTGTDPGAIKAASKAAGNLAQWRDWETPALQ